MPITKDFNVDHILSKLLIALPPIFSRKEVPNLLGGSISVGTLANAECGGYGPPCVRNCRNCIYEKDSFLQWFKVYLEGGLKGVQAVYGEDDLSN